MHRILKINDLDNVAVALTNLREGEILSSDTEEITLVHSILRGHKFALADIKNGENIMKYGAPIGHATADIPKGDWVHTHNVKTNLHDNLEYTYQPDFKELPKTDRGTFMGYPRSNGNPGIRNEVWVIPTVGCVNGVSLRLANTMNERLLKNVDGVHAFPHPYGCSQLGDDLENTRKALAAMVHHPNAGAVLVIGLGCENNGIMDFKKLLGDYDPARVKFITSQLVDDEYEEGLALLGELMEHANQTERQPCDLSGLVVGLKCGGSDGLSGVTANPLVGRFSDILISAGGSTMLTEVPEMFGAETVLMKRAINEDIFHSMVDMINDFKDYFKFNNQPIYENPSPGNKDGGITSLEDKSLGCIQKGGRAPISDVLTYAQHIRTTGLSLLNAPGNDLVSSSALALSGAQMVLFTTGRGTPFGSPVPNIKISTNTPLAKKKPHWIDFDAGRTLDEITFDDAAEELFRYVVDVASGKETNTEKSNIRELAIFKTGVTL